MIPIKVNIYETVEVSDEQRVMLGQINDEPGAKKRQATREELKTFIWRHGEDWPVELQDRFDQEPGDTQSDDDLI